MRQARLQSNQEIWIVAGNTGVLLADNFPIKTQGVATKVWTKEFTERDLEYQADQIGLEQLMSAAGGLPLAQVPDLFRQDLPLEIHLITHPQGLSQLLETRSHWFGVSKEQLNQCVTGAHPYALQLLFNELTSAANQPIL